MKRMAFGLFLISLSTLGAGAFVGERVLKSLGEIPSEFRAATVVMSEIYRSISVESLVELRRRKHSVIQSIREGLRVQLARVRATITDFDITPLQLGALSPEQKEAFLGTVPQEIKPKLEAGILEQGDLLAIYEATASKLYEESSAFADLLEKAKGEEGEVGALAGQRAKVTIEFGRMLVILGSLERMAEAPI